MKLLVSLVLMAAALPLLASEESFYVGTYTKPAGSRGIYRCSLNTATGEVKGGELAAETENPTFLAIRPGGKFLYAANEVNKGAVSGYAIQPDGKLKPLNRGSSGGAGPAHIWVDSSGRNALVANYGGGSVSVLPIHEDGTLGEPSCTVQHTGSSVDPNRQKEPHAHSIYTDATDRFAYTCDLGLDQVLVYKFDPAKGLLTPNDPPFARIAPGSGPRHLAFHPKGYAYVINEMANTITAMTHDAQAGVLKEFQTIRTLPEGYSGENSTAEIFIHPNGKFLFGSNRGNNSIAVFAIDAGTGKLTLVELTSTQGRNPRNFAIDPAGKFLLAANQDTDNVVVFRIDEETGRLTPAGQSFKCGAPVCVMFVDGK